MSGRGQHDWPRLGSASFVNQKAASKRLLAFVTITFSISWGAWWALVALVPNKGLTFDNLPIVTLYVLGGSGPTIAAFVAVLATPMEGSFREFSSRLFRWRVNAGWYVFAFALPVILEFVPSRLVSTLEGAPQAPFALQPFWRVLPLFGTMIIGGGLEELGWRGVAQPTLEKQSGRLLATTIVGAIWAAWHLPLFFVHGVAQFHRNFPLFALYILGNAFFLAWLYAGTHSILLCVCFDAAINTAAAMNPTLASSNLTAAFMAAVINLALGVVLVLASQRRPVGADS
jgi:membrane protease YdiL (CAAX protease family)